MLDPASGIKGHASAMDREQEEEEEEEEVGTPLLFLSTNGFNEISGAATEGRQTGSKQAE